LVPIGPGDRNKGYCGDHTLADRIVDHASPLGLDENVPDLLVLGSRIIVITDELMLVGSLLGGRGELLS
jgi:hypothetical protein